MSKIIDIAVREIGGQMVQSVDGRALHAFLGLARDFNQWMREQIDRARLVEGRDWVSYEDVGNPSGGRPRKEYALTVEAGKHIGMMSGTDKGFEIRDYFIECERQLKAVPALNPANMTRLQLLEMAMQAEQERIALESKVLEQAPKVEVYERIADAEGSITLRETANTLQVPERKFILMLQEHGWVYRRAGHKSLLAYADKVKSGYLVLKQTPIRDMHTGEERLSEQVRVTPLGMTVLARSVPRWSGQAPAAVAGFIPSGSPQVIYRPTA